ncbi:hypothetical protein TRSC58_04453 [Trypanosoma rangeli SC58]|uniref:MRH domain-containing protein n=1 Tax=Trypanosoma rangeli SC58 TaxID=429131 RepID=A0A061IYU7_TRYRA|nr:hypothetical protein TRSC58_04453 [Trypanosoma rangeli SC58]
MGCIRWSQSGYCGDEEELPFSDKGCDEVISSSEAGFCECSRKEEDSKVAYDKECGHEPLQCSKVCEENAESEESDADRFDMDDGSLFQLPEAKDLRSELKELHDKVDKLSSSVEEIGKRLNRSVNTEDILRTLNNECFTLDVKSYTYELCPFKDTHQYDKGSTHGPNMGRWEKFGDSTYSLWSTTGDYTHMIYENGDRCWNGVPRMSDVHVVCGPENKLTQVEEPSMCRYSMVFQTPAVCE